MQRARATAEAERAVIAIFHATTKPLSRSAGRSSVAAAAYRAGVKLEDHRTAMVFDFTRRSGVMSADIVAPDDAAEFASDRTSLWNAAEQAEKRKDSRTAREWIVALPAELDAEQRTDLARDFARELVKRYGVAADVAIHAPSRGGNDRNYHAHILCTTRVVSGDKLGEKSELELSDSKRKTLGLVPAADEISTLRERWAALANAVLEKAGTAARIDHRSLAAQQADAFERGDLPEALALDREPQRHVGVHATHLDRRSGAVVSERGQTRERAVAAAHRAAYSAAKRSPILIDAQRAAALELVRAEVGPVWVGNDPAPANDASGWVASDPNRAESDPVAAESTLHAAAGGSTRVDSDPHEEASMIQWHERPRPVADLESEIGRLSRGLEARLDEAIPDRRRAREAVAVAKWRDASVRDAQELIAAGEAEIKHWDRQHRWQSLLDRVGIRQDSERRTLSASLAEWRAALEEAQTQAARAKSEARTLVSAVQERDRVERPAIEAADAVEAAEVPSLQRELDKAKAKAFESAQETHLQERAQAQQTSQTEAAPVPKVALNQERVAAFERRRVDRAGPEHSYQVEFDRAARVGLLVWDNIAVRGTAAALIHNTPGQCRAALAACWPGNPARVDDLVEEGRAQRVVDQVREVIETGAEPLTVEGEQLMALVAGQDDAAARTAVGENLKSYLLALASDPGLRPEQESDRPAPRPS